MIDQPYQSPCDLDAQPAQGDRRPNLLFASLAEGHTNTSGDKAHRKAGLRCAEMMVLEWSDVDLERGQLRVRQSDWKGHVTEPKSGRLRPFH